jgi:chromosomal replication initiation ATPase DnaA
MYNFFLVNQELKMCFPYFQLHQNGKQVILTSDKAPVDMQDIEQRLLSRFKWGLSAEVTNLITILEFLS